MRKAGILLMILVALMAPQAARASGSAYLELLNASDFKSLQRFYRLYVSRETGLASDIEGEIRLLRRNSKALRGLRKAKSGKGGDCQADCAALQKADAALARADAAMNEARRILRGNLRILNHDLDVATKGDANMMDARAAHERRKFGFDMGMIVTKAFQMNPGPLLAQLGKDLGLSASVADAGGDAAATVGDAARLYLMKGSMMTEDAKRSAFTAVAKAAANKLFGQSGAEAQFVSSFVQNMASGLWEAWNEALKVAEEEGAKPALTSGMISMVVLQSTLGAMADARERELANAVNESRKDERAAESRRLLAAAEYKAMARLGRRILERKLGRPAGGLAFSLSWERGRFRTAMNEWCGGHAGMPRVAEVPVGDQKEVVPAQVELARALAALREANDMLRVELERLRKQGCGGNTGEVSAKDRLEVSLVGRWIFGRGMEHGRPVDKRLCTLELTDRRVPGKGYVIRGCDPNESYWELTGDGALLFRHRDGSVTTRFTRKGKDAWEGPYFPRPDHPDLGKVQHYLRRARTGH